MRPNRSSTLYRDLVRLFGRLRISTVRQNDSMQPEALLHNARQLIASGATAKEAFVRLAEECCRPPPALAQAVCVAVTGVSWQRAAEIFDEVFMRASQMQ